MPDTTRQSIKESLDIPKDAKFEQQFVKETLSDIQEAWDANESWRNQRQVDYSYMYGLTGRQNPELPYVGSPDIRDRWMLTAVHEMMPKFVLPLFLAPHIVKFSGGAASDGRMEDFYDTAFRYKIPNFLQVVQGAAFRLLAHPGNCIIKVVYDPVSHLQTKAEKVPEDLRNRIEQLDMQVRIAETQQQVAEHAQTLGQATQDGQKQNQGEETPAGSPSTESPLPNTPQASASAPAPPPLQDTEQLREMPLKLVAMKYRYNLEDDADRKRAEAAIKQIRGDDDVVVAIIKRDIFPLKLSFVDQVTDFIVPKGTTDLQEAPWVVELQFYNEVQMRDAEASGKFKNVDEVLADSDKYNQRFNGDRADDSLVPWERAEFDLLRQWVQGIMPDNNATLPNTTAVYERHCWLPRNEIKRFNGEDSDDETFVRAVVNIAAYADPAHSVLRMMEHPDDFEGLFNWPFIQIRHFDTGEGFYCGKGLPFMSLPMVQEYLETHNAAVIRDILGSMPIFAWNSRVLRNDTNTPEQRRLPGANFDVEGDPSKMLNIYQIPDLGQKMHTNAQENRAMGNRAMGIPDATNMPSYDRPANQQLTQAMTGPMSDVLRHEVNNWLDGWSKVFQMCHLVMKQNWWLDTTEKQRSLPNVEDGSTITVEPKDFAPDYIIRAGGEPDLGDQQQLSQRFIAFMQNIAINPTTGWMTNPAEWIPDGTSILVGSTRSRKWLLPPDKIQQAQQMWTKALAEAMAARQANKQKRQGASTSAAGKGMPGAQVGANPGRTL